jgi:hypothetical protein
VKHVKAEILPTNRKHVPVEVVQFGDTENHSENEKKMMKRRIKKKIKIKDKDTVERRLPNVSLRDLYTPPNINFLTKLRRKRGLGTWRR